MWMGNIEIRMSLTWQYHHQIGESMGCVKSFAITHFHFLWCVCVNLFKICGFERDMTPVLHRNVPSIDMAGFIFIILPKTHSRKTYFCPISNYLKSYLWPKTQVGRANKNLKILQNTFLSPIMRPANPWKTRQKGLQIILPSDVIASLR